MKNFLPFLIAIILSPYLFAQSSVFVNQAGYLPNSEKIVVANSDGDTFYVYNSQNDELVYTGAFTQTFVNDPLCGSDLKTGDFSELTTHGNFYIETEEGNRSFAFEISDTVFVNAYKSAQKAFYFQRCGSRLLMENAGAYHHLACHTQDAVYHSSTGLSGFKYAVGGWHDAGDYGKYVVNSGITVGTLLLAYELFPEYFSDDNLNIPESRNNTPDLLDEVRYELEWLLKMQDENGGVFAKLTPKNFSPFVMPEQDDATRYLYEISSAATADFAAVMARAARIYSSFDTSFASECLNASLNAWNFLSLNPDIVPSGGFINPDDTHTGEYGDTYDKDERLWAAAELYAATRQSEFENYYLNNFNSVGLFSSMSWQWVAPLAHFTYLLNVNEPNELTVEILKSSLEQYTEEIKTKMNANAFAVPLSDYEFYWGSNGSVLNSAIFLIIKDKINGADDEINFVIKILNYVLGCNPINISYVSGIGTESLSHPHHRQSESDNVEAPVPGLLAGGPNQYLQDPTLQALFDENTPPALCYVDTVSSYASNEIAINWNAPLVFVSGYVNGKALPDDVENREESKPEEIRLYQNYPNPYNSDTLINFEIRNGGKVKLEIYDLLGRKVATLLNKNLAAGKYTVRVTDDYNLSTGVYVYRLQAGTNFVSKKMILLK